MADTDFQMVPQLSKSKHLVMELPLCRVMLEDTSDFVWLVLVPMKNNKKEIHELSKEERTTLMEEMNKAALAVQAVATTLNGKPPTKINTGALGNICPQLHIHVLARYEGDKAWPGPVWGACAAVPWDPETKDKVIALITAELQK